MGRVFLKNMTKHTLSSIHSHYQTVLDFQEKHGNPKKWFTLFKVTLWNGSDLKWQESLIQIPVVPNSCVGAYLSECVSLVQETVPPLWRSLSGVRSLGFSSDWLIDWWYLAQQVGQPVDTDCYNEPPEWGTWRSQPGIFFFLTETSWYNCLMIICIISNTHTRTNTGTHTHTRAHGNDRLPLLILVNIVYTLYTKQNSTEIWQYLIYYIHGLSLFIAIKCLIFNLLIMATMVITVPPVGQMVAVQQDKNLYFNLCYYYYLFCFDTWCRNYG